MSRKKVKDISDEAFFPEEALNKAKLVLSLQQKVMNLNKNNFDETLTFILTSIFIQKENISSLADVLVTACYVRPANIRAIANLTQKLICSQGSTNHLVVLKDKILKFVFKSIACNLSTNRKRVQFLLFIRFLFLEKFYTIDEIYNFSTKPISIVTYTRYFFPEFETINALIFHYKPEEQIKEIVEEMDAYYQENKEEWATILEKGYAASDELEEALMTDNCERLQLLMSDIPSIDHKCKWLPMNPVSCEYKDITMLDFASLFSSVNCFKYLLSNNATIEKRDFFSIECAIRGGSLEIIRELDRCGTSFKNIDYESPIRYCFAYYRNEFAAWMLAAKIPDTNQKKFIANDSVDLAGDSGNIEGLLFLINEMRVNIQHRGKGRPFIVAAAENGHRDYVELLCSSKEVNINDTSAKLKKSAILSAAEHGFLKIVRVLIANNADVNVQMGDWQTPFYVAAQNGYIKVLHELAKVPDININVTEHTTTGKTPFLAAIASGHLDCVKFIAGLDGVDTSKKGFNNIPAYVFALQLPPEKAIPMIKFLVTVKPPLDVKSRTKNEKLTSYQYALYAGQVECAKIMSKVKGMFTKISSIEEDIITNGVFSRIGDQLMLEFVPKVKCLMDNNIRFNTILNREFIVHAFPPEGKEEIDIEEEFHEFIELMLSYGYFPKIEQEGTNLTDFKVTFTEIAIPPKNTSQKTKKSKTHKKQARLDEEKIDKKSNKGKNKSSD